MTSFTAHQTFTLARINRHGNFYPRLYVKEQPSYRFTRMVLSKVGFIGAAVLSLMGLVLITFV